MKMAETINLRIKIMYKNAIKKWNKAKKKWESRKFGTRNQDCPSKSGTVGGYGVVESQAA